MIHRLSIKSKSKSGGFVIFLGEERDSVSLVKVATMIGATCIGTVLETTR